MPPNQTILGIEFFEIEYLPLIQHIFPLILSCQNVTLRSKNTVSERDTLIQEYRVGTWHSNPRIPCRNVTLRSKNTVSERDTPIQEYRVGTWHSDPRIPCRNVTLRSNYTINLSFIITAFNSLLYYFHRAFFIEGITSIDRSREYKFYGLRISDQSQTTQPNHTITQPST